MARKANTQEDKTMKASGDRHNAEGDAAFVSPFAALKGKKILGKNSGATPVPAPAKPQTPASPRAPLDEENIFREAMRSTMPLRGKEKITPEKTAARPAPPAPAPKATEEQPAPTAKSARSGGQFARSQPDQSLPFSSPPETEENLFAEAMAGVAPVRAGGRDLAPPPDPGTQRRNVAKEALDSMLDSKLEFAIEYSEEFIEGHVLGLEPIVVTKLRAGQFSHEAHLDLHGRNVEQAYAALAHFLKESYQSGKRHLLLITGRGRNSPGGAPVLRERVQAWFTRDPFKRVVLAFCSAQPRDGGAGAVYVLLRKRKKNQGKIIWDRMPTEEELLL